MEAMKYVRWSFVVWVFCFNMLFSREKTNQLVLDNNTEKIKKNSDRKLNLAMILWRGKTAAEDGFLEKAKDLGYQLKITEINADHNLNFLNQKLSTDFSPKQFDYIYSFGTLASIVASSWSKGMTPLIFNAVSFPHEVGLVPQSNLIDHGNLSGIGVSAPLELQISNAKTIISPLKNVAVLVDSREWNFNNVYTILSEKSSTLGIKPVAYNLSNDKELKSFFSKTVIENRKSIDAIYITAASLLIENIDFIASQCQQLGIPTIAEMDEMINKGCLCGTVADYYSAGESAAEILHESFSGKKLKNIPVKTPKFHFKINPETAKKFNIEVKLSNDTPL